MHVYKDIKKLQRRANSRGQQSVRHMVPRPVPTSFSLRPYVTTIFDQGQLGSCTANAFAGAHCILQNLAGHRPIITPSRLYYYYYERWAENNNSSQGLTDSGADEIDGLQLAKTRGVCAESQWPYIINQYNVRPPATCDVDASRRKISAWGQLSLSTNNVNIIKNFLVQHNTPVLLAMNVFQNFESNSTAMSGIIPMPSGSPIGGHEMCIIGYDDAHQWFVLINSWGNNWGDHGFCYLPYAYANSNNVIELSYFTL